MLDWLTLGNAKAFLECIAIAKDHFLTKESHKKADFELLISPLFEALRPLVDDYFLLFRKAYDDLSNCNTEDDYRRATQHLRENRERLLTTRILVRESAAQLSLAVHDQRVAKFLRHVVGVFECIEVPIVKGGVSISRRIVNILNDIEEQPHNVSRAKFCIVASLEHIEREWTAAAQCYAQLRIRYLRKIHI